MWWMATVDLDHYNIDIPLGGESCEDFLRRHEPSAKV